MKRLANVCLIAGFIVSVWFAVHTEPGPTPDVVPPPVVVVDPYVAPIAGGGLSVLIVYESEDIAPGMSAVMDAAEWQEFVSGKSGQWRKLDDDSVISEQKWADALKRPRTGMPWVIVSGAKSAYEGLMPKTLPEFMDLLRKHG